MNKPSLPSEKSGVVLVDRGSISWCMSRLFVVVLSLLGGCADTSNTLPIDSFVVTFGEPVALSAKSSQPEIVVLGQRLEKLGDRPLIVIDCLLVNPLDVPITCRAYTSDSWQKSPPTGEIHPLYGLDVKDDEDESWRADLNGWCGTGAGDLMVRPKRAGRFQVFIHSMVHSARVTLSCHWQLHGETKRAALSSADIRIIAE